jgi:hypothetical protein
MLQKSLLHALLLGFNIVILANTIIIATTITAISSSSFTIAYYDKLYPINQMQLVSIRNINHLI